MSSSDSSSSDSEMSGDESMDDIVSKTFGFMKKSLAVDMKGKTQQKYFTNKHHLIYDTFKKTNDTNTDADNFENNENSKMSSEIDFFIDKGHLNQLDKGDNDNVSDNDTNKCNNHDTEKDSDDDVEEELDKDNGENIIEKKKKIGQLSSRLVTDIKMNDVYVNVNPLSKKGSRKETASKQKHKEPEVMKKSVISEDFEKQDSIATTHTSVRQQKKQRRLEREKTKGGKWFNMPATEITDERKYDLSLLQMRKSLDPKRFYKANDLKTAPKYFQFGEVVADASDFYSSRIPKKQRKSTIVEELLADADFRKFNKRKYAEVQDAKRQGKGPYKHMKRLKKAKK